nr:MAG TPA: hypothetical protein [Caudoviricetes sp.]
MKDASSPLNLYKIHDLTLLYVSILTSFIIYLSLDIKYLNYLFAIFLC